MNRKHLLSSFLALSMLSAGGNPVWAGVSGSTIRLLLTDQTMSAQVNNATEPLAAAPQIQDGSFFVPVKWVADKLDLKTVWSQERQTVGLTAPRAYIEWDLAARTASANGATVPLEQVAFVENGTLMVKLSWLAPYLGAEIAFQPNPASVSLTYVQPTDTAYRESAYPEDRQPNSRPIARFMTDKAVYRLGEAVEYIDLSYDPDAEGLPKYEWSGKKAAFFEPGTYTVSLQVADRHESWSEPYTQTITVNNEPFLSSFEFAWYKQPIGSTAKGTPAEWKQLMEKASDLALIQSHTNDRLWISSGNGDAIMKPGLLRLERVEQSGPIRLYSHHINESPEKTQFATVIQNPSNSSKLVVRVSRQGLMSPTLFYQQTGAQAAANFLHAGASERVLEIAPGKSETLNRFVMESGQAFASITDIETDGAADIGFIADSANKDLKTLQGYTSDLSALAEAKPVSYSDVSLEASAGAMPQLSKWTLGSADKSEAGAVYGLRLYYPGKAAIAVRAKEGFANGMLKVNGSIVTLPQGGLTEEDGALLVYRSDSPQAVVQLEWMAAPGAPHPIEFIYYPLANKNGSSPYERKD